MESVKTLRPIDAIDWEYNLHRICPDSFTKVIQCLRIWTIPIRCDLRQQSRQAWLKICDPNRPALAIRVRFLGDSDSPSQRPNGVGSRWDFLVEQPAEIRQISAQGGLVERCKFSTIVRR
jgi:hypothetical protein